MAAAAEGEPECVFKILILGHGESESAMEDVSGAQCVHGVDGEGGGLAEAAAIRIEPHCSLEPRVPARKDGVTLASFCNAAASSAMSAVA
jgi:hypothetical protein